MQQQLHQFQLAVEPLPNASYALTVLQRPFPASRNGRSLPSVKMGSIDGLALLSAWDIVLDMLRSNQHKPAAIQHDKKKRFGLSEESGVRLSLLFKAIAPLSNLDHIRVLQQAIWAMSDEEAYYWFSKCHGANERRGCRHCGFFVEVWIERRDSGAAWCVHRKKLPDRLAQ